MKRKFKPTQAEGKIVAFLTIFGLTSIVLKLSGVISWSWYLVTLPFWIFWFFFALVITFALIAGLVVHSIKVLMR